MRRGSRLPQEVLFGAIGISGVTWKSDADGHATGFDAGELIRRVVAAITP